MKEQTLKILKIAVGCTVSVLLANLIGLKSSTSAGIITLLSIQDTKRETLQVASRRVAAFFVALGCAFLAFSILGYRVPAFGLFLLIFVTFCYCINLAAGISTNAVLISHLWSAGEISFDLVLNEFLILIIGTAVAILINLYMPRLLPVIRQEQQIIDHTMKKVLITMAKSIRTGCMATDWPDEFHTLADQIGQARHHAQQYQNNTLSFDMRYYVRYMSLRFAQAEILHKMAKAVNRIHCKTEQNILIADFLEHIAASFHEYNNAKSLLEDLEALRKKTRKSLLPQSRNEFETRALLFQLTIDLEYFLLIKKRFAESLSQWEINYFWKTSNSPKIEQTE